MGLLSTLNLKESKSAAAPPMPPMDDDAAEPVQRSGAAAPKVKGKANVPTPMPPVNQEIGFGDNSLGLQQSEDGTQLTIKHEKKHNVARHNFAIWVIPCYIKADLKASIQGSLTLAKDTVQGGVGGSVAGCLELGVGTSNEAVTAGPYGAAELSATQTVTVTYVKKTKDASIDAFVINVYATGKVGIKIEVEKGPTFNSECQLANWHLFVIYIGAYSNGKFESFRVEPGKDMQRLVAALQTVGPKVADAVEKYAPKFVKDAAEDAAKWTAESPDAKKIGDGTEVVLEKIKKETGSDIGAGTESVVRDLVDPGGETSAEATERVKKEAETFNASHEDFHECMVASGLQTTLFKFRSAAEYNAIVEAWRVESEALVKGGSASGKWRQMLEQLVAKARDRKAQQEAAARAKRAAEAAEKKRQSDAELAERIRDAMGQMEHARVQAQGPGNHLNNTTAKTPNPKARQYWEQGMKMWFAGETAHKKAGALQGMDKVNMAHQATAQYVKAKTVFQAGVQQL